MSYGRDGQPHVPRRPTQLAKVASKNFRTTFAQRGGATS